jgi:hypothetical protein
LPETRNTRQQQRPSEDRGCPAPQRRLRKGGRRRRANARTWVHRNPKWISRGTHVSFLWHRTPFGFSTTKNPATAQPVPLPGCDYIRPSDPA